MKSNKRVGKTLFTAWLFAVVAAWDASGASSQPGAAAVNLRADYRDTPLGIDRLPVKFFWRVEAGERPGAAQRAYQIQASGDREALLAGASLLWDSGKVSSSANFQIPYSGKALSSRQRVWWRVKLWDEDGIEGPWSEPTWFETGLLKEADWGRSQWIGCSRDYLAPETAPDEVMGEWIAADAARICRSLFTDVRLPDKPVVAAMAYWGFDRPAGQAGVAINYDTAGTVAQKAMDHATGADKGGYLDLAFYLKPGKTNRIQILFRNPAKDVTAVAGVRIVFADGQEMVVKSGADWKAEIQGADGAAGQVFAKEAYGGSHFGRVEILSQTSLAPAWFRKVVEVGEGLRRARLYLAALGYGMPYVNGQFAGNGLLSPPQSDYEDHAYYTSQDVTRFLKTGSNAVSILLDGGWYHEAGGFRTTFSYGRPGLKALLVLDYADGRSEWIPSGSDWQWKEGAIRSANIYQGERVDYRKDQDEWKSAEKGGGWKPAAVQRPLTPKLAAMDIEPMRATGPIRPVRQWRSGPKTWLFDMGEVLHGWVRLKLNEPEGAKVYLRYSEYAEPGKIRNVPLSHWWCHGVMQSDIITCDGTPRVFEPVFTPKSYRYVEVCGLSHEPAGDDLEGVLVCSSAPALSTFASSDPVLNRLYENGMRTFRNYMNNVFGDLPRERCLWGADSIYSWVPAFNCFDWAPHHRLMDDLWVTGRMAPGGIPGDIGVGLRRTTEAADFTWSSTPIYLSYRILKHYGDTEPARAAYPVLKNLLLHFRKTSVKGAFPLENLYSDHARALDIPRAPTSKPLIAAMNFYDSEIQFAEIAEQLGHTEDAAEAQNHAEIVRKEILGVYDRKNHTFGNSTHDSLALAHGILKDAAEESALAHSLVDVFRNNGHKFDAGYMGYEIYPMLSRYGYGDDALEMLRNSDYPGPAWSIREYDATTFWEAYYYDKEFQLNRGLDFIAYAHSVGWLITDLSGIRPDPAVPGGQKLIMAPVIPRSEKPDWVKATLKTQQGTVQSTWNCRRGELEWEILIPANTKAELRIPADTPGDVSVPKEFESLGFRDGRAIYEAVPGKYRIKSRISKQE